MSRSGYTDDFDDNLALGRWRAIVASTIRGKRGQAFLKEMLAALDALSEKRLIRNALVIDGFGDPYTDDIIVGADELVARDGTVCAMGDVCAMGAVGKARGLNLGEIDPEDPPSVAAAFGISEPLAQEIAYENDEGGVGKIENGKWVPETPEERFVRVREWVASKINPESKEATNG